MTAGRLIFGDGPLGQFPEEGEGIGLFVSGFDHHEDGGADQDHLDQAVDVEAGDGTDDGPDDLIGDEPGDEEIKALEGMEADRAVLAEGSDASTTMPAIQPTQGM